MVLLKHLVPATDLAIDILFIFLDFKGGQNVKVVLSGRLKRAILTSVTISYPYLNI